MRTTPLSTIGMLMLMALSIGGSPHLTHAEEPERAEVFPGRVRLILPPVIYATPDVECNIYFDNAILTTNGNDYAFDVTCPVGLQFQERWAFLPTPQDAGDHPISIEVHDESNAVVARARSTIRVARPKSSVDQPATLLIVGDSLTEASVYPRHVLELANTGGATRLCLIGTRGPKNMPPTGDVRHEGYSGWTAEAFATLAGPLSRSGYYRRGATGSPFVYELADGSKALDFSRYCAEVNRGKCPDLVTIGLGTNDVFSANDETIDATIDRVFVHYDAVVESIRRACGKTRIGVQMTTPGSTSQDGFRNYRGIGKQTRWQFRRNQHRLMERILEHFGDREDEQIYLIPTYLNLDAAHHFPTWSPTRSARSAVTVERVNNGTHPAEPGYQQIGDAIYSWVVDMLGAMN